MDFITYTLCKWHRTNLRNCSLLQTDNARGLMSKHIFSRQIAPIVYIFSRQMEAIVYIGQRQVKVLNSGSAILDSTISEVSKFFVQLVCEHEGSSLWLVIVIKNCVDFGKSNRISEFLRLRPCCCVFNAALTS